MTLADWMPAIVCMAGTIFTAGVTVSTQRDHSRQLLRHDERLDTVEDTQIDHGLKLAKLEGWREGYNAGVAKQT